MGAWRSAEQRTKDRFRALLDPRRQPERAVEELVEASPPARPPILVLAYEGWSDAGEAASSAAAYLSRVLGATEIASISSDDFFDFTDVRPMVSRQGGKRRIVWPSTTFSLVKGDDEHPDLVIVTGPEPQLRWQSYADAVVGIAKGLGVVKAIALGAYLGEVTHYRAVPVGASSNDEGMARKEGLATSLYEGPTGILGVLDAALDDAGIPSVAIWASVPCYSVPVSPKASLALLSVFSRIIGRSLDLGPLEQEAREYEERMDEIVADDENIAAYVARIEEFEQSVPVEVSAEGLAQEIERYLRDERSS